MPFTAIFTSSRSLHWGPPLDLETPARPQELAAQCRARETKNFGRDVPAASGGCQVPELPIDPRLGRGRAAPSSARRGRLGLRRAAGLDAGDAGRRHCAAQGPAGRAKRASRGAECARRRVCKRAGGAAPARSPLVQLRHRFQGSCNPIPSDSQALSDSSDLVHPREGGKRERKKVPTVCPSWHPIDFLEEGPIPAWRPARVEEPPHPPLLPSAARATHAVEKLSLGSARPSSHSLLPFSPLPPPSARASPPPSFNRCCRTLPSPSLPLPPPPPPPNLFSFCYSTPRRRDAPSS